MLDTLAADVELGVTITEQNAEHHRGIAVAGGVDDGHTEFDSAHDRVGTAATDLGSASTAARGPSELTDTHSEHEYSPPYVPSGREPSIGLVAAVRGG
jgi:hypothetical protein